MFKYKFPISDVKYGSRVVIYGAGNVGMDYLAQIVEYNLCKLVCIIDEKADELSAEDIRIEKPDYLCKCKFDYLIIAIKNLKLASEIKEKIQKEIPGISDKIIHSVIPRENRQNVCLIKSEPPRPLDVEKITIAANMIGGIGDAIFAKKIICEIGRLADNCQIDIYVEKHIYNFVNVLYMDTEFVKNIYDSSEYQFHGIHHSYDLAIAPAYIFTVSFVDYDSLKRKNEYFAEIINRIEKYLREEGLSNNHTIDNGIQFARAKKRGYNAYTIFSFGGLLPINESRVNIPLLPDCISEYKKIGEIGDKKVFVTINYGWIDKTSGIAGKIWPLEYFNKLVTLIKSKYPDMYVVQIGKSNVAKISGVDMLLRGFNIEIVKYVLRDSLIHIDSEGGLVHLATQLGTKCLVAFGPTPVHFFGYESNINVVAEVCNNCAFLDADFSKCIRGLERPECMYSITPEIMFENFEKYISGQFV